MDYEVEGVRPRGRPKKAWSEVVEKRLSDCRVVMQMKHPVCYFMNLGYLLLHWFSVHL